MGDLRTLLRSPSLQRLAGYGAATGCGALATLLAVPLLVRLLGLDEFGTWSLLEPLLVIGAMVALCGVEHGVIKQAAHDGTSIRKVVGDLLPAVLLVILLVDLIGATVLHWWFGAAVSLLVAGLVAAEALLTLITTAYRSADRLALYSVGQAGRSVSFLIVLAVMAMLSPAGRTPVETLLGVRLALVLALALALIAALRPRPRWRPDRHADARTYGVFILLTGLMGQVLENCDRYLLAGHASIAEVGGYVLHIKLATIVVQGVTTPFMIWFPMERFRHFNDSDGGDRFFGTVAFLMLTALLLAAGIVWFSAPLLLGWFAPEIPYAPGVLLLLLAGVVAVGMSYPLNVGLLKPGFTHLNLIASAAGLTGALVLSVLLVPALGMIGGAGAKAAATLVFTAVLCGLSQRVHRVNFRFARLALLSAAAMALGVIIERFAGGGELPAVIGKSLTYACGLLVIAFLLSGRREGFRVALARADGRVDG